MATTTPPPAPSRPLRVGELARRCGLTVRALHHYDAIGLVSPGGRSAGGYRLYGEADVARLMQVLMLRRLGLSLPEVQRCIENPATTLADTLRRQARRLRQQVALQTTLLERLDSLAEGLEGGGRASLEELTETMEMFAMFEKYYTPEQIENLQSRRQDLGKARIAAVEAEWPRLIAAMQSAMERDADPSSGEVQALAARWRELLAEFTGGDADIQQSLNRMYAEEPAVRERTGIDPALMEYVGRAMKAR